MPTAQAERRRAERAQPPPDAAIIAAITLLLLSGLSLAALLSALSVLLAPLGIGASAVARALAIVGPANLVFAEIASPSTEPTALRALERTAATRRAMYLLAAARRLDVAEDAGDPQTIERAVAKERRYLNAHLAAEKKRRAGAERIDRAAAEFGPVLGWHSVRDERTTPVCRAAHGHNFRAATPPAIGWPGTRYAGNCRCTPRAPYRGAAMLP